MKTRAQMEFDGNIEYEVELRATQDVVAEATSGWRSPSSAAVATVHDGAGRQGRRPPGLATSGPGTCEKNQDSAWIGDVNAGLQFTLKDDKYSRPLNTNFYHSKPLVMPASWSNGGTRRLPVRRTRRRHVPGRLLQRRRARSKQGEVAALRLPAAAHALPPDRHEGAVHDAVLPRLQAGDGGGRHRREHAEHPPRQRDQPVHQLPVPAPGGR